MKKAESLRALLGKTCRTILSARSAALAKTCLKTHKKKAAEKEPLEVMIAPVPVKKDTVYKEVAPEVDPVAPIKEEKVVDTESDSIRAYYVIVGSFKSKQRVENLRKRLVFMGFKESAILRNENGMYRVTTAPFNTHTDCWNEVFLIRKKYPQFADAWGLAVR